MVLQTIVQGNQKDGKTNWWSIDFGPIVEYARFSHMSPQRVFMVHYHHQFLLPLSTYCIISVLSLDVLCHGHFVWILRKRLMTMLCYVLVVGQGLSVQRTLPHTCFPHFAIKLPWHGLTRYNTCFYTTFISIYVLEITPIIIIIITMYFIAHYYTTCYANYGKIA